MCKTPAELLYRFVVLLPAVANDAVELNVEEVPGKTRATKIESAYNLRKYGDIFELLDQEARVTDIRKKEKKLGISSESPVESQLRGHRHFRNASSTLLTTVLTSYSIPRRKISSSAEPDMDPEVLAGLSINDYGGAVAEALKTNTTSWVLLNMATFYHRLLGNAHAGLECSRRALHFSPQKHKDIAMASIASILYRADYPHDALMILRAAIDISGGSAGAFTLMGFILASTSEFDAAVGAFSDAAKFAKDDKKLDEYRYAVRCHARVHRALSEQHQDLREIIRQFDNIGTLTRKVDAIWSVLHAVRTNSVQVLLHAYGRRQVPSTHSFRPDGSYDFGFPPHERKPLSWLDGITLHDATKAERFSRLFPGSDFEFVGSDWPTNEDCDLRQTRDIGSFRPTSVIIPWENKGFEFWSVVGRLHVAEVIPLPYCESVPYKLPSTTAEMFGPYKTVNSTQSHPDKDMQEVISSYMRRCGTIDEFGRKITLAQVLNLLPDWMFFDMAALYWRARGSPYQVAECYGRAFHAVPDNFKDVVYVGMASFFRFMNQSDSSLFLMGEIAEANTKEPATLYTIGTILGFHGFLSLSIRNYKLALLQDVSFYPAFQAFKNARCTQSLIAPGQKNANPEVEKYQIHRNGIIEIDIGILGLDIGSLRQSLAGIVQEDLLLDSRQNERVRKIAFSDLKKLANKKRH
ncbi:putative Tetratricopeptide repeat protein 17 [Hypsibius exemplaris]|uniref:Tetratricopeptide repeat protein 17 n=1 Tax=Hypsibius exemplaris TaxID=2072580 RepID=A0A1W0WAK2_HYPEX|nr:putative Tetratricopeptide repeat protein 17 [Hypsibius exemplaris]